MRLGREDLRVFDDLKEIRGVCAEGVGTDHPESVNANIRRGLSEKVSSTHFGE